MKALLYTTMNTSLPYVAYQVSFKTKGKIY